MRRYHHMGIPTTEQKEGEVYDPKLKYTSTPYGANEFHVQWHRFDDDCPLPEIIKVTPHVAFQVDDLDKEIEGRNIVLGPYSPIEGFRVAVIEENGAVVEFIETDLTDEERSSPNFPVKSQLAIFLEIAPSSSLGHPYSSRMCRRTVKS